MYRTIIPHRVKYAAHALFPCQRRFLALVSDPFLVEDSHAPKNFDKPSAVVYPEAITASEHDALVAQIEPLLKRRRYEKGHWDSVILQYKEIELTEQEPVVQSILERIRNELKSYKRPQASWLPCHAIDLHKDGELNAHVDSVRFSGDLVAGLSLLSSSILRLKPDASNEPREGHVDLWLPIRSLYVLSGISRYSYTHELLPSQATFRGNTVERDRRISILFRDAKVCDSICSNTQLLLSLMINAYHWNYRLTHMKRILRLE